MLLGGIGIVKPQITQAAKFLGNTKIQTDGFGMANVQVPIRLRRKPGMYSLTKSSRVLIGRDQSPNKIEFLRFEEGSPLPELLQTVPHIAYEVQCLKEAIEGKEILMEPFEGGENLTCAFIVEEGIPIPTPDTEENADMVGAYEGGGYVVEGVYRPLSDCTMKSITVDNFCPVCRRAVQQMIDFYTE